MEQGIFGIQPWAVLLFGVILILGFVIYSTRRSSTNLYRMTEGKMLIDFWCKSGEIKTFLCDEVRGEVKPPKDYKGDVKRLKAIRAPAGIESDIDVYYTIPEFTGDTWFPPMRPKNKQVKIKKTVFVVGIPLPAVYVTLEKWTPEMLEELASSLIGLKDDEKTLMALNAQDASFWNNLERFGAMLQKLPTMQIACFVAAGAAVIGAFLALQLAGKIDELFSIFTGGK